MNRVATRLTVLPWSATAACLTSLGLAAFLVGCGERTTVLNDDSPPAARENERRAVRVATARPKAAAPRTIVQVSNDTEAEAPRHPDQNQAPAAAPPANADKTVCTDWDFIAIDAPWDAPPRLYPGQIMVDPSFPSEPQLPIGPAGKTGRISDESETPATQPDKARHSPAQLPAAPPPRGVIDSKELSARESGWPLPAALLAEFDALTAEAICVPWLLEAREELHRLTQVSTLTDPAIAESFAHLQRLTESAPAIAQRMNTERTRGQFLRAAYGLARRLAVWTNLAEFARSDRGPHQPSAGDMKYLVERRAEVLAYVSQREFAEAWTKFLLLEESRKLTANPQQITTHDRVLARRMLLRLDTQNLNEKQLVYLKAPVFGQWGDALRRYCQEPLDVSRVLAALERYEEKLTDIDGAQIAHGFEVLHWSPRASEVRQSEALNDHYRNANVRVAISGDLINRLLHEPQTVDEPVNDVIRDAHVFGHSHTSARVRVELLPDRRQWRLGLEARGDVSATTQSRKGPATFLQDAWSNFSARKQLTVDRRGVRTENTEVKARSTSDLRSFATDFDHVPLFGGLARAIARNQYHEQLNAAQSEVEQKVADKAREKLDEEVTKRLSDAEGEFHKKWLKPLQRLGLEPTPVDMETTQTRLIVRYRLAGGHQLAAHTARPQAPANSWLSVQIHESAVNNTLAQLGFEGRRIKLRDLYAELAAKFDRPAPEVPDDVPDNVSVLFAEHDAVRIRCEQDRVSVTLRIAELAQGSKTKWHNFVVRAEYVPVVDQRDANLVRDGIIELSGDKRSLGNQVVLKGIFAKVLSRNRPITLVNQSLAKKPELSDLEVNQCVILDGWIGVALAPKPNTARPPATTTVR